MYHFSQRLANIVKPMVYNEDQQPDELEAKWTNFGDN